MPTTGDPLARRYRRLLLCYPRAYRRTRGAEIVATLLDAAPPGRSRPTVREAANLARHGLRCRLGRPASRTVVVCAVLTAITCGLVSAAVASRVAWEAARPLPQPAEAAAMFATVLADYELGELTPDRTLVVEYAPAGSRENLDTLILGDVGEYQRGGVEIVQDPPVARQRLPDTYAYDVRDTHAGYRCDPAAVRQDSGYQHSIVIARCGDAIVELDGPRYADDGRYSAVFHLWRATPPAVYPAAVIAGLLGAAAAWLLFGWASRRTEPGHHARPAVSGLYATALILWWSPILLAAPYLISHYLRGRPSWPSLWEWLGQLTGSLLFLLGCGSALLALALAALPKRDPDPLPTVATGRRASS